MRILHIISSLGTGGAEKLILDTLPLYNKKGITVDVLLLWNNKHQFTEKLIRLNCCKVYIINESSNYRDMYSLLNIFKIRNIMKKYDIVHTHLFSPQYFTAIANYGLNKKLVFTEHCTSNRRIRNKFYKIFEKWCYSRYNRIVSISDEIKSLYEEYLGIGYKIEVINNGVNLDEIKNSKSYLKSELHPSILKEDTILIQVSAFREQKDQDTVIKMLKYLPDNYKLLLVGDGVRRKVLEDLVNYLDLKNRVFLLGQRMDVPSLIKSSDFIILSSFYEGLSLASVEGLASGKPVVASDVPGLTEIVKDAGILFPLQDEKKLAEIILQLNKDSVAYNDCVQNCIERSKKYDISNMVIQHINLYRSVYEN